jgi:uncharacterized protein YjiS (DUF1127 family)
MMWAEPHRAWWESAFEVSLARRWPLPRQPRETDAERLARHAADRRRLARLNDRLLQDIGLDRDAVERGLPFLDPVAAAESVSYSLRRLR